jgi:hypothetical protein
MNAIIFECYLLTYIILYTVTFNLLEKTKIRVYNDMYVNK